MALAINITDGRDLNNKAVTAKEEQGNAVLAIHFTVKGDLLPVRD